jgi:hypothetical protein
MSYGYAERADTMASMTLQLRGWIREIISGEPKRPFLYDVSGLPGDMACIVGDAGLTDRGERQWFGHVYSTGKLLHHLGPYVSPEEVLPALEEYLKTGTR